MAKPHFIIAHC